MKKSQNQPIKTESVETQTYLVPHIKNQPPTRQHASQPEVCTSYQKRTLLVGDSTIKLIDKWRLIRGQKVSKAWAATVEHAETKISNGDNTSKDNIIFALGVNDLKDNSIDVETFITNLKSLILKSHEIYPESQIHLCSVLPVDERRIPRGNVIRVNSFMENMPSYVSYVNYINTIEDFVSQIDQRTFWDEDHMHPNLAGTLSICSNIRKSLIKESSNIHRPVAHTQRQSTLSEPQRIGNASNIRKPAHHTQGQNAPSETHRTKNSPPPPKKDPVSQSLPAPRDEKDTLKFNPPECHRVSTPMPHPPM